jgi:hypothetical protein
MSIDELLKEHDPGATNAIQMSNKPTHHISMQPYTANHVSITI